MAARCWLHILLTVVCLTWLAAALPAKAPEDSVDYEDILKTLAKDKETAKEKVVIPADTSSEKETESEIVSPEIADKETVGADPHMFLVDNWPVKPLKLGEVAGVATEAGGSVVVLHRADREWDAHTFDEGHHFMLKKKGAIKEATILNLNKTTGEVLASRGKNKFYMPHGLTVDREGNIWVTDVAMHQVFKFAPGSDDPVLTLGKAFQPVSDLEDTSGFCKPTDVAVATNGDFFVSDGYCNSRVLKYNKAGELLGIFGQGEFWLPHGLALLEDKDMICVADRENRRIACHNAGLQDARLLGRPERQYAQDYLGRVYGIEYNPNDELLYGVSGPLGLLPGEGFTIDTTVLDADAAVIDAWSPNEKGFDAAHDVTVSPDGASVYVGETIPNNLWKFSRQ